MKWRPVAALQFFFSEPILGLHCNTTKKPEQINFASEFVRLARSTAVVTPFLGGIHELKHLGGDWILNQALSPFSSGQGKSLTILKKGTHLFSLAEFPGTQTLMYNNCSPYFLPSKLTNNGYLEPKNDLYFWRSTFPKQGRISKQNKGSLWILCRSPPGSPQRTPKPLVPGRRTLISTFQVIFHVFFGIFLGAPKQTNTKNIERKLGSEEDLSEICQLCLGFDIRCSGWWNMARLAASGLDGFAQDKHHLQLFFCKLWNLQRCSDMSTVETFSGSLGKTKHVIQQTPYLGI